MMIRSLFLTLLVVLAVVHVGFAQPKGKYIPTKYDTVRKKIPQQVYGNKKPGTVAQPVTKPQKKDSLAVVPEKPVVPVVTPPKDTLPEKPKEIDVKSEEPVKPPKPKKEKPAKSGKTDKQTQPSTAPPVIREEEKELKTKEDELIVPQEFPDPAAPDKRKKTIMREKWTLQQCIEYAREHNLQVAEAELNERLARLVLHQNRNNRMPTLNGDASLGESYGRSIDPTSNQFVTAGFVYNSLGLSSQTLLFGWFQRKYAIDQSRLDLEASYEANNQMKDDIALNVATGFLRVLLAREQVKINKSQLQLDNEQYAQTVKFANAGKLPELNVAQMLAQLSTDSANLINANVEERMALLQLRALMNFSFDQDFDIEAPDLDMASITSVSNLSSPEYVFNTALKNQHRMKYNDLKLQSAKRTLDIAKAVQYPQLSLLGSLATNFSSTIKDVTGQTYIGESPLGNVRIGNTDYLITRPNYSFDTRTRSVWNQYGDNIRANIGIGLSVPIFNSFSASTNIQKARIGLVSQQIVSDNDKQKLRQDIYKAYEEAKASAQKYNAAKRAKEAAGRALDFAVKRYEIGMINTFEYTSTLNSFYNASSSLLSAKYDLVFKQKVLDYYLGNPLKL